MGNQTGSANAALDALGDPTRRLIIERLGRGAVPVGKLSEEIGRAHV